MEKRGPGHGSGPQSRASHRLTMSLVTGRSSVREKSVVNQFIGWATCAPCSATRPGNGTPSGPGRARLFDERFGDQRISRVRPGWFGSWPSQLGLGCLSGADSWRDGSTIVRPISVTPRAPLALLVRSPTRGRTHHGFGPQTGGGSIVSVGRLPLPALPEPSRRLMARTVMG